MKTTFTLILLALFITSCESDDDREALYMQIDVEGQGFYDVRIGEVDLFDEQHFILSSTNNLSSKRIDFYGRHGWVRVEVFEADQAVTVTASGNVKGDHQSHLLSKGDFITLETKF